MNSQKYNKDEIYPEDYDDDDKLEFDILLENSKMLFPKLANDEWLIKKGIHAYIRKKKIGDVEPPTQEEINEIRNRYTNDTVFHYKEPENKPYENINEVSIELATE